MVERFGDTGSQDPVEALIASVVASVGFELVEYTRGRGKKALLRVTIDAINGDGGVTIDDCAQVSRMLGPALDAEEMVLGAYVLEVSSPGVERPLKRPKDFVRFQGRRACFKLSVAMSGRNMLSGIIADSDEEGVTLDVGGEAVRVEFGRIAKANLEFRFEQRK